MDAQHLTQTRRATHGDWKEQSRMADDFLNLLENSRNWKTMAPYQRIALLMILTKVSRIATGNADEDDHWDDIGGYARLGKQGHDQ